MNFSFLTATKSSKKPHYHVVAAYQDTSKKKAVVKHKWNKEIAQAFKEMPNNSIFTGASESIFKFCSKDKKTIIIALGLGEENKSNNEIIRKTTAKAYKALKNDGLSEAVFDLDTFTSIKDTATKAKIITETIVMSGYVFDKYKSKKDEPTLKKILFQTTDKIANKQNLLKNAQALGESVNLARELTNEVPNILNSETYAKLLQKDAAQLPGVQVKTLNKAQIKKEKMNLLLAVNAGSAYEPRLVHLTYTPKKKSKNKKHIALVGKGITFDTGGYNLKPSASIVTMKTDMGGSATLYAAFKAAVLSGCPHKLTCVLALTDNAVNENATMPDSIIKARNGKTVEILNTDAEGRLILADALDYTCELKPNVIIDAATLTGACLVALGTEVCAVMGNEDKSIGEILKAAKRQDEYLWQLPIIEEWRKDMKSKNADLKNTGGSRFAGTVKAAAFLQEFIKNDIPWLHLDIAGVCDNQSHLPYCPSHGASGIMVRSVCDYILNYE
ncbi:MAG: leucyl aminopeptidase [Bacteriovoracia bacterium]